MRAVARFSLLPRDSTFFDLLHRGRARTASQAARLLDRMMGEWPDAGDLPRQIVDAEHEGDRITHEIVKRLNSTFVTPIDREDIYGLATQLDDIVDYTEEAADFLGLYQIEAPMEQAGGADQGPGRAPASSSPPGSSTCPRSRTSTSTGSRSTGSRTRATGSPATPSPRSSPTGSTRWS